MVGSEMSTVTLWRVGPSGVVFALVLLRLTKRSAIAWESRSGWTHDRDLACNARLETRIQNKGGVSGAPSLKRRCILVGTRPYIVIL